MSSSVEKTMVIIVGAGPSGLATAACLHQLSIPYIILEKEDCVASLFKTKAYDRLHLHIAKHFCHLPHMPFPKTYPTYVPKNQFLKYLDDYASHFKINPMFQNLVQFAKYDEDTKKWKVEAKNNGKGGGLRYYEGRFLVVATGENSNVFIPEVDGLSQFKGEVIHSTQYKSGNGYEKKNILVVGAGNSGMEIAVDLCNHGANTSVVVRSPTHVISRRIINIGLVLLAFFPMHLVDSLLVLLSKIMYGDLTKYGIQRPQEGPTLLKLRDGKYPIIDVGACKKIKSFEIQVLCAVKRIKDGGNEVVFENEKCLQFDAIIFATGFKRSTHLWLQGDEYLLNKDGLPKVKYPNHWKGENGLYCVGLSRFGLYGAGMDAQNISYHIFNQISK